MQRITRTVRQNFAILHRQGTKRQIAPCVFKQRRRTQVTNTADEESQPEQLRPHLDLSEFSQDGQLTEIPIEQFPQKTSEIENEIPIELLVNKDVNTARIDAALSQHADQISRKFNTDIYEPNPEIILGVQDSHPRSLANFKQVELECIEEREDHERKMLQQENISIGSTNIGSSGKARTNSSTLGFLRNRRQGGLTQEELEQADKDRIARIRLRGIEPKKRSNESITISRRASMEDVQINHTMSKNFIPEEIEEAKRAYCFKPGKLEQIKTLHYVDHEDFMKCKVSTIPGNRNETKYITAGSVNPSYNRMNRISSKYDTAKRALDQKRKVKFALMVKPLDSICPTYFSRGFFRNLRESDVMAFAGMFMPSYDPHGTNLKDIYAENSRNFNFNLPITHKVYDRLHFSREDPDGNCLLPFSPFILNSMCTMDGLKLENMEHTMNNYRDLELVKHKCLFETLHVLDTLINRCVFEDSCGMLFCRENDDLSIIEYYQYCYNMYNSTVFDWCRGQTLSSTEFPNSYYEAPSLLLDYCRALNDGEVVSSHAWNDCGKLTESYLPSEYLAAKKMWEVISDNEMGLATGEKTVLSGEKLSEFKEDLDRVGANHQNWYDYMEMKQWAQCMEMINGKVQNEEVIKNGIYFSRDPIDPMSGAKNIRDAAKSVQFNKLNFYSYKNRDVDEHGLPVPEFTLQYRQPWQMDKSLKRKCLSSLPKYSTRENFDPVKDIEYKTLSQEYLFKDRIERFHTFPQANTGYIPIKDEAEHKNFFKMLEKEVIGQTEGIAYCEEDVLAKDTILKRKIEELLNRYFYLLKAHIKESIRNFSHNVHPRDPSWIKGLVQIQTDKTKIYEFPYFTPGGLGGLAYHKNSDSGWVQMAHSMQMLSNLVGDLDSTAHFIANEMVYAPWESSCRSAVGTKEVSNTFSTKLSDNFTVTRTARKIMEAHILNAYQDKYNADSLPMVMTNMLKPYYEEAHLAKKLTRPKTEMLEENDYMFVGYMSDFFLRAQDDILAGVKTLMNDLDKACAQKQIPCSSLKEATKLDIIAPLLNSDISDIECMQTLVKIEGLEDDEFLQFVCNNEHAMQTIRNKAFGVTCSTDTMPMLVPPLPHIGNSMGGNIIKSNYNHLLYDNIELPVINGYHNKHIVNGYVNVKDCSAEEMYAENMVTSTLEESPLSLDTGCRQLHLGLRRFFERTGAWNEKIRMGANYLPYPCFTTKMLKRFISSDQELSEIKAYSQKFGSDEVYLASSKVFKKDMDNRFMSGDTYRHLTGTESGQRKAAMGKIHEWSFGNNQSEYGIAKRLQMVGLDIVGVGMALARGIPPIYNNLIFSFLNSLAFITFFLKPRFFCPTKRLLANYQRVFTATEGTRTEGQFWMTNMNDFRGRVYGFGVLNPTNQKVSRALISFGHAKKVGEREKYWLYVHMANSAGWDDKESNDARFKATESRLDFIQQIGNDPIHTQALWDTLDNPWQSITTAIHIAKYLKSRENGEDYYCNLPVFQDGTCNGLQHYGAMSRSQTVCDLVNLAPYDRPQDIYGAIASRLKDRIYSDFEMGKHQLPDHLISKVKQLISRKIVKRPIMTLPYGSCGFGWEEMIRDEIIKMVSNGDIDIDVHGIITISKFLRIKIESVIRDTLNEVIEHQRWIGHLIGCMNRSNAPVRWHNPFGTPLSMRNFKLGNADNKNKTQPPWTLIPLNRADEEYHELYEQEMLRELPTDGGKNLSGFSPNFIHAIDATHLKMANFDYRTKGAILAGVEPHTLSWISVHDSFGIGCDMVDMFNKIIRDTFVELWTIDHRAQVVQDFMYSQMDQREKMFDFLMKLQENGKLDTNEGVENRLLGHYDQLLEDMNQLPPMNTFDLKLVKESPYFFS